LSGGEDYELLFTVINMIMTRLKKTMPCPITVIGEITQGKPGHVTLIDAGGNAIPRQKAGWEHFKSQ